MADKQKPDPLDPLENAYYETTEGEKPEEAVDESPDLGAGEADEVFHGEPVDYEPPPPPPSVSPLSKVVRILPFVVGGGLLVGLVYLGYTYFSKPKSKGPVELVYWTLWEEDSVLQPLIDEYKKKNPNVTVKLKRQTPTQYRERLEARINAGEGPDIFRFHNTWVPMLKEELAPVPKEIISFEDFQKIYYPVMVEDLRVGNDIVGLPLMFDGLMVFYNREILRAGGYDKPASGWNEFLVQADALTVKNQSGQIVTAGAALGRADNIEHFSDIIGLLLFQNGANPARPESEAGVGALAFYRLFAQEPDNVWGSEFDNDILAFAGGRVGMIFAPSWEAITIKAVNPQIDFGTAPVPQVEGAGTQVSWASYWVEGVNSRSKNQKAAWELVKFLSTQESLEKFYSLAAQTRAFGEPYPRKDMAGKLGDNEYLAALAAQADTAQSFYMASRTFDNGLNDRIIKFWEDAVNSLDEGNSPEAAVSTVSQGTQQVLSSFNVRIK